MHVVKGRQYSAYIVHGINRRDGLDGISDRLSTLIVANLDFSIIETNSTAQLSLQIGRVVSVLYI